MKTIYLTSLLISLGSLSFAQQTPTPPKTPTTTTTVSTSSSSTHSILANDVENLFISVIETDKSYKLKAKFQPKYDAALKEILMNEFGRENLQIDGNEWIWLLASDSDEIYSIKFSSGKLRMKLDKKQATNTLTEKFIYTGEKVEQLLSDKEGE